MAEKNLKYKINHPYIEEINPKSDFVDLEIEYGGKEYSCSVTTTGFIDERLDYCRKSGENRGGIYFWAKGMLILNEIKEDTIEKTLEDLIERGNLEEFLKS